MQLKRTLNVALPLVLAIGTLGVSLAQLAPAAGQPEVTGQEDADAQAKIENAMSAAPSTVSAASTILDNELDDAGKFVVLRGGSNGWFCFPDIPSSPGNDPQCMDQTWL